MAHLIDKDALVAEIERLRKIQPTDVFQPKEQNKIDWLAGKEFAIITLQVFLDTLEAKESKLPNPRFPHFNNIVDKVFGRGNLESLEYDEAEQLVLLAKEELLKDLEVKEVDICEEEERIWKDFNIGECHLSKNDLEKIAKHFFELGIKTKKGEEV